MDITLFGAVGEMIQTIGVTNTLIAIVLTMAVGWIYKNERKQKKIKEDNTTSQMANVVSTIASQTDILHEVQRTSNATKEIIQELSGKFDATNTIITELMKRDIGRSAPEQGGQ